jgi:predicted phage terminase large subunit-like protein
MHGNLDRALTQSDLALIEAEACVEAQESLWAYRQHINPFMKRGWWQREVANQLQKFFEDFKQGKRPKLLLQSPPQHGKSISVVDFVSWVAGHDPSNKVIYSSFSDRLGIRANLRLQRTYDSERYKKVFPNTKISAENIVTQSGRWLRNREIIEYCDTEGYFRNTTVNGTINGEGLDIGVIDDAIKGRAEASSKTVRDKTWDWLTDDFGARFSDHAALLMITTRWHVDDPAGRMIERYPDLRVLRYPALAEHDEPHRRKGEPLFPEFKSLTFLLARKGEMTQAGWESVYQQSPIIVGGGSFPIDKFTIIPQCPSRNEVKRSVRYWDKAGSKGTGAFTVGVLMHMLNDGRFVISNVKREQLGAFEREKLIKNTAETDNSDGWVVDTFTEQEPGSGGKESAERTIVNLAGFNAYKDRVRGNKELRAEPYAAQVQAGNVFLVAGKWNDDFVDEHETFPSGKYKDQVDAAGGAFAKLVAKRFQDNTPEFPGLPISRPVGVDDNTIPSPVTTTQKAEPVVGRLLYTSQ